MDRQGTHTIRPDLSGKAALITGASSGIGEATARVLADDGADVVLAARSEDRLRSIADDVEREADVEAAVVPTDVTDDEQVAATVEAAVERFGRLDVVVANAGLGIDEPVESMATETYRTMTDVNVDGTFFLARETIPHLREREGTLVFISSFAGQYPRPANPVYAATKWWVRGFARSLEASVGPDGVAVTTINPTEVRTQFGSEGGEAMESTFDPGEVTEPLEVAEAVSFAARQRPPNTVSSLDLYRRDKMEHF